MPEDRMWLNALLTEEQAAEFEMVKGYHGLQTNSEVVRYLIHQEARKIQPQLVPVLASEQG